MPDQIKWPAGYVPEDDIAPPPGYKMEPQGPLEFNKPKWYDNYLALVYPIVGGFYSSSSRTFEAMDKAATFLSKKLGISKGGAFKRLSDDLGSLGQNLRGKGVQGPVGDVAAGIGGAGWDIPTIAAFGKYGLPIHGAAMGAAEGGLTGALTGAATGALSHGALQGMGGLTTPARIGAGAAFGAATTPGGLEERIKGAATMGALGAIGGKSQQRVVDQREPVVGKIRVKGPKVVEDTTPEPIKKVISAINKARPVRREQEAAYTQERGKRIAQSQEIGEQTSGEAGFMAEKGALKGELPKIGFESIRGEIGQPDIDSIFDMVKQHPRLTPWEKVSAREGLSKLFAEKIGVVPQQSEIALLNEVFGKKFTQSVLSKQGAWANVKRGILEVANVPRSLMSSFDFSAPFRQGVFLINHPKRFFGSFLRMFRAFDSDKAYQAIMDDVYKKPSYQLMREHGLQITDIDALPTSHEEAFMSNWAERIPIAGKIVRGSSRAYTGFLNKLRADVFDDLVNKADKLGLFKGENGANHPNNNPRVIDDLANFVNTATGRGSLGRLKNWGPALNAFFFSPRLMSSRIHLLRPDYYIRLDPFVRKEALKSLVTFAGAGLIGLQLAKMGGAEVEDNPTSADFGKIKIGPTRIDPWGGFQQYVRTAAQLLAGQTTSTTSGKVTKVGKGYKPLTRWEILMRAMESKQAPVASFVRDWLKGQSVTGDKFSLDQELVSRFTPMVIQDLYDIHAADPDLVPLALFGVFGFGMQTYTKKKKR